MTRHFEKFYQGFLYVAFFVVSSIVFLCSVFFFVQRCLVYSQTLEGLEGSRSGSLAEKLITSQQYSG